MDWIKRLNQGPRKLELGAGTVELLDWAYAPHLVDNVPHRHTHFEICQVGAYGAGQFVVEGKRYDIEPGDLFIARPGVVHQIVNTGRPDMELFWVAFIWTPGEDGPTGELDTLLQLFADSSVLIDPDTGGRIALLWQSLRAVAESGPLPGYRQQLESLTVSLLVAIAQAGAGPQVPAAQEPAGQDDGAVRSRLAVRYIHDNLDRRIPVSELAAHLHLSPRQLTRLFARYLGTSPAAYIEEVRLDHARALLVHTSTAIKGIAAAVGYESVHHFSRAFSRRFGRSPGALRHAHMEKLRQLQPETAGETQQENVPIRQSPGAARQRQAGQALLQ